MGDSDQMKYFSERGRHRECCLIKVQNRMSAIFKVAIFSSLPLIIYVYASGFSETLSEFLLRVLQNIRVEFDTMKRFDFKFVGY